MRRMNDDDRAFYLALGLILAMMGITGVLAWLARLATSLYARV